MAKRALSAVKIAAPVRLDLGCGKSKIAPDWIGVDSRKFDGVDKVLNLCARVKYEGVLRDEKTGRVMGYGGTPPGPIPFAAWPWEDESVEEARASHFVEHLDPDERIHFVNQLHRVLVPGGKAQIITPHWCSERAYGDLTHKWPPVSEFWFYYLNKAWREANAPHNDEYTCDFDFGGGHSEHPRLAGRSNEHKQFALENYKGAAMDLIVTLTKREPGK